MHIWQWHSVAEPTPKLQSARGHRPWSGPLQPHQHEAHMVMHIWQPPPRCRLQSTHGPYKSGSCALQWAASTLPFGKIALQMSCLSYLRGPRMTYFKLSVSKGPCLCTLQRQGAAAPAPKLQGTHGHRHLSSNLEQHLCSVTSAQAQSTHTAINIWQQPHPAAAPTCRI